MRRVLFVLLAAAACGGSSAPQTGATPASTTKRDPGAATPTAAIAAFMGAIKDQDLDALSYIWGSERGPASEIVDKSQLRKRELIMECYFQHDSYRIVTDVAATSTQHVVTLQVTKGTFTRETKTQVVLGPKDRWFVANPELVPLKDLCSGQSSTSG
jgi:hypothetical protein